MSTAKAMWTGIPNICDQPSGDNTDDDQWRTEGGGAGGGAAAPGAGGRGAPKWASKHRGPGTIFSIGLLEPAGTIASAMKCTYPRKIHACIACNH
jgi:hypothetical protein